MPRPRFLKLGESRQLDILDVSAREFSLSGFDKTSLNKVINSSGLSKGAFYYYFDDKEDLFFTTVDFFFKRLNFNSLLTSGDFWENLGKFYCENILNNLKTPWRFSILKRMEDIKSDKGEKLVKSGISSFKVILRELSSMGIIRDDLPLDFVSELFFAISDAATGWIIKNLNNLTEDNIENYLNEMVESIRRVISSENFHIN